MLLSQPFVPLNSAVMVWLPMLNADELNDACPFASRGTVANIVGPSLKLTEPVGVPGAALLGVTVAVKVTT